MACGKQHVNHRINEVDVRLNGNSIVSDKYTYFSKESYFPTEAHIFSRTSTYHTLSVQVHTYVE
jgi:hypothetical protein